MKARAIYDALIHFGGTGHRTMTDKAMSELNKLCESNDALIKEQAEHANQIMYLTDSLSYCIEMIDAYAEHHDLPEELRNLSAHCLGTLIGLNEWEDIKDEEFTNDEERIDIVANHDRELLERFVKWNFIEQDAIELMDNIDEFLDAEQDNDG